MAALNEWAKAEGISTRRASEMACAAFLDQKGVPPPEGYPSWAEMSAAVFPRQPARWEKAIPTILATLQKSPVPLPPREIALQADFSEDEVTRALTALRLRGSVLHVAHGRWALEPYNGPVLKFPLEKSIETLLHTPHRSRDIYHRLGGLYALKTIQTTLWKLKRQKRITRLDSGKWQATASAPQLKKEQ